MPILRGTLSSFDAGTYRAVVRLDGSAAQTLTDVRTSRGIASAEMVAARRVLVDTGDHGDIADVVLFAVYAA
jgi:hypothetical protein